MSYQANFTFNPYPLETNHINTVCPYRPFHVTDNGQTGNAAAISSSQYIPQRPVFVAPSYALNTSYPDPNIELVELPSIVISPVPTFDTKNQATKDSIPQRPPVVIDQYNASDQNANREG